jgi:hypothetical protein
MTVGDARLLQLALRLTQEDVISISGTRFQGSPLYVCHYRKMHVLEL